MFPLTSVSVSRSQTCPVSGSRILMCGGLCGGERETETIEEDSWGDVHGTPSTDSVHSSLLPLYLLHSSTLT